MTFNPYMRVLFIIFLFQFILPFTVRADTVDQYIKTQMQQEKIPGLSLVVIKDGKIIKSAGYGLANVELNVPATPSTVYQLGSVGKQFTAELILQLVEQGKLNLDDKISKYIKNTPPSWQNITIRQLLTHTSGIKEYTSTTVNGPSSVNQRLDYTNDQLVKLFESYPLDFKPGDKWSYSDTGYVLLGIIIKNVTGKFYGDLLQQNIFKPLDMNATRIISESDIIKNRAAGYWLDKGVLKNQEYVSPSLNTTADGAIYSTVLDMAKLDAALDTNKILKTPELKLMWTPVRLNNGKTYRDATDGYYGMGWFIDSINGHLLLDHYGWWQGFTSYYARYPNDKLTIIILTNLANASVDKIAKHVAGLYNSELMPKSFNKAILLKQNSN